MYLSQIINPANAENTVVKKLDTNKCMKQVIRLIDNGKKIKKHIDLSLWMHRLPSRVWVSDGNPGFALGDGLWSGEGVSME